MAGIFDIAEQINHLSDDNQFENTKIDDLIKQEKLRHFECIAKLERERTVINDAYKAKREEIQKALDEAARLAGDPPKPTKEAEKQKKNKQSPIKRRGIGGDELADACKLAKNARSKAVLTTKQIGKMSGLEGTQLSRFCLGTLKSVTEKTMAGVRKFVAQYKLLPSNPKPNSKKVQAQSDEVVDPDLAIDSDNDSDSGIAAPSTTNKKAKKSQLPPLDPDDSIYD